MAAQFQLQARKRPCDRLTLLMGASFGVDRHLARDGDRPGTGATPAVLHRISRFALQQRSRIDAPDRADGTKRLMWAMLKDTLSCYHAYADATTVHKQRLFREAERWILSSDLSWMFSFENVCAVLNIDSDCLRTEIRRWRRARRQHA